MATPATGWELYSQVATVVGGVATAAMAGVACYAIKFAREQAAFARDQATFTREQVMHQSASRDFQAFIDLQREINRAWEPVVLGREPQRFHVGQLLSTYESACYVFNRGIVGKTVTDLFKDQFIEVFDNFSRDESIQRTMKEITSGKNTFAEIKEFLHHHSEDFQRHRAWLIDTGIIKNASA